MPFKVTDNQTGKTITFENKPTEDDINEAFGMAKETPTAQEQPSAISVKTPEVQPVTKQTPAEPIQETLENIPKGLEMAQKKTGEMLSNIPGSTINLIKNTAGAFIHPIQTGKGLFKLATLDDTAWTQIANFYKERYGGVKELENTVIKDPVGFAADVSTLLSVVGGATKLVGKVGKVETLQKTGQTFSEAGKATDPFRAIGKTITWTGQKASDVASNILGMTTGTGKAAIKQAFKGGEEFTKGLRGKIDAQTVLDNAMDALNEIKDQRRTTYQTQLAGLKDKANIVIDKKPVFNQLKTSLKSFNIEAYLDDTGKLVVDTSKSALDKSARGAIAELVEDVLKWDDWSPAGADILKQRIDDFYAPTKNSRALVSPLKNAVKQQIVKQVPEYSEMLKGYEKASNDIKEITQTLLSGKRDTALRKLNIALRDNNEYRQAVLGKLDALTEGKLTEQLAGVTLSTAMPRGWPSKVVPTAAASIAALYNPLLTGGILAASSPRLMGEMALKAGQAGRGAEQAGKALMPHWKYLYQVGRTQGLLENLLENKKK